MGGNYLHWLVVYHLLCAPVHLEGFYFDKRNPHKRISDLPKSNLTPRCIPATITEPGVYLLHVTPEDDVCSSIVLAPPGQLIHVTIVKSSVNCETGFVDLLDGMRTSGGTFPDDAVQWLEVCESPVRALRTNANVGMLRYYIEEEDEVMELWIEFILNPSPCDTVVVADEGSMEIKSTGNCTVLLLNSKVIQITEMNIGKRRRRFYRQNPPHTGKCVNTKDNLEILGGSDIGKDAMAIFSRLCGRSNGGVDEGVHGISVPCRYTMLKLTSSGISSNVARIEWKTNEGNYDDRCL